jgi:hypothetical protein
MQRVALGLAVVVDRIGIAPAGQPVALLIGAIEYAPHPATILQMAT